MKEIEIISKRKPNEKHFLREDGTFVAKIYPKDIHYQKNGHYEEIDNSLIKKNGYYQNKKNDYKVSYKENTKDSFLRMEKGNDYLELKLKDANEVKAKKIRKNLDITYQNILEGIDILYQTLPTKVKETICLQNEEASRKKLSFLVNTNLTLSLEHNTILAKRENQVIFIVDAPYMEDSSGKVSHDVFYLLEEKDENYEIKLQLDYEWLTFGNVKYPVRIDPTITNQSQGGGVYDTYIYPGDAGEVRHNQPILKAGVEKVNGVDRINRTLLKFNLPTIGTGSEVVQASLTLCGYLLEDITNVAPNQKVHIHRITTPWTEKTASWDNMSHNYDERVDAVQFVNRSFIENGMIHPQYTSEQYNDITDLVKHWYQDTPNYGILIKSEKEVYVDSAYPAFYSKNHTIENANPAPVLTIIYRNQSGLESYYDYQSQSFTDGTTSINTYNGNLVGVFELASTIGSKLPVALKLIYNTNDVIVKNNGFKFNLHQTVKEVTIDNKQYYEYVDGDGTTHYFQNQKHRVLKPGKKEPTIDDILNPNYNEDDWYETREYCSDEDGLMQKLEKENENYIIIDKYNNRMIFSKNNGSDELYYLKEFVDASSYRIQIIYSQDNKLVKMVDSDNDEITIDYSTNNIMKVKSPDSESIIGITDNKVNYITTRNGTTTFEYNSKNVISAITDTNDTKIVYEYYDEIPYRIKKVIHYGLNQVLGKSLTFNYGFNETSVVDNKNRANLILFNSSGNKISSNTLGSEEDLNHAYSTFNSMSENNDTRYYEKNKPLSTTPMFRYIKNMIPNSSFETDQYEFQNGEVETSFSTDYSVSGNRSLKVMGKGNKALIGYVAIDAEDGEYYTFSGYFKNDQPVTLQFFYFSNDGIKESSKVIEASDDFKRHDLSIYHEPDGTVLAFRILFEDNSVTYIDDIQLEEGEVANDYNIVENSDFSYGLSGWVTSPIDASKTDTYQVVKFNHNKNRALKINLNNSRSISKKIPVHGNAGDSYDISFWLKNEGIFSDNSSIINSVNIEYEPIDVNQQQYAIVNDAFIPNKKWQFLNYKSIAPYDYKSITISFNHINEVNEMWITNIFFCKDLNTTYYDYDTYGNLISTNDTNNVRNTFQYDKSNQLINATTPKGKRFKYEYDNVVKDRVTSAITSTGINNKITYDSFGNPISTRISKKSLYQLPANFSPIVGIDSETMIEGTYKIRSRGTEKYLKAEYSNILLEKDSCSNTLWNLEKSGDMFKIVYTLIPSFSIEYTNNIVILNDKNQNNLFHLEENKNGSYYLKLANKTQYLKSNGTSLEVANLVADDPSFEFYFELLEEEFIENTATYTEDGKFLTSVTDSNLNKTEYDTDTKTGLTKSMTNAKGQITRYTYNNKKQVTSVTQKEKVVNYTYNNQDMLDKIVQGNKEYKFTYDDFLNLKTVKIGDNITLVTNEYEENNGNLVKTTYGNNQEITFAYDQFDRTKELHKMDHNYSFRYNSNGNIAKIISDASTEQFYYDNSNRLISKKDEDFEINYDYNKNNSITDRNYKLKDKENQIHYTLDESDNLLMASMDNQVFSYQYDNLERLVSKKINDNYNINYNYISMGKRTSTLVNSIQNGNNKYSYKYDSLNNITHIYYNNILKNQYYYDEYNELIKEENKERNEKTEYIYDNSGNLLTKITKNLETDAIIRTDTYEYQNSNWEDQLTRFNNQEITYDAIGNPLSVGNSITLDWINGRSLNSYKDTSKNLEINYKYNKDGIRTEKNVNGEITKYYLENNNIIYEQRGNNTIYYLYDLTGLVGFKYNDNTYYYIKNLQGDIIGILDKDYNEIVTYEYDSWGKLLSIKDNNQNEITDETNIGIINPFRYREYYYDTETGLYYLNSRYYNPVWGSFINVDGIIGANQDMLGYNLYAYTSNNPITLVDSDGNFAAAAGAFIGANLQMTNKKTATVKKSENKNKLPTISEPNSRLKKPNGDLRDYGSDGRATKDTDYSHPNHHPELSNPHFHDWNWDEDGIPHRGEPYNSSADKIIVDTTITIGTGYLIYRGIRLIPSLIPSFWWTIPLNVSMP